MWSRWSSIIAAFQLLTAQQLWDLPKYLVDGSNTLCITPVTQHQTMEIVTVMTSVSPNSQTKGLNSRPSKNTPEPCCWLTTECVCVLVKKCFSEAKRGMVGSDDTSEWKNTWAMTLPGLISHSVLRQRTLLAKDLITRCPEAFSLDSYICWMFSAVSVLSLFVVDCNVDLMTVD